MAIYLLCRESNSNLLSSRLRELLDSVDRGEPKFPNLYYEISCLLTRLCGKNEEVLELSSTFLDRAMKLNSEESRYMSEMGYLLSIQRKHKQALDSYRRAHKYDDTNLQALYGTIYCQICLNLLDDAASQVRCSHDGELVSHILHHCTA